MGDDNFGKCSVCGIEFTERSGTRTDKETGEKECHPYHGRATTGGETITLKPWQATAVLGVVMIPTICGMWYLWLKFVEVPILKLLW